MLYIRPENRDTRYALWFDRYECTIPYIQMRTIEDLEQNGMPTSGDRHHDHATQWEPIRTMQPIHRMAEMWASGANVRLRKKDDAPKIYQAINLHLQAWKHHIETSYHPNKPPYEDLLVLDGFANVIYEHAKFVYDTNYITKHFKISKSGAIGRRAMLAGIMDVENRRRDLADKGIITTRNIDFREAAPRYNPDAEATFIDYSGSTKPIEAPVRESMGKFFKKGKA